MHPGTSQSGSANTNTTSDEAKVSASASASPLPLAAGQGRLLQNGSAELLEAFRPPMFTSGEAGGSAAMSASGRSDLSAGPSAGASGNLASPWSDVTALLRARSDFSDIEVGPLIGRGSFGRVYKGGFLKESFFSMTTTFRRAAYWRLPLLSLATLARHVDRCWKFCMFRIF